MIYLPVSGKFLIALIGSAAWVAFSIWAAQAWLTDLKSHIGAVLAVFLVYGIAIVPGFMNAFLAISLLLDKRPPHSTLLTYPPISILIAAYNEEASIEETLVSIERQNYPGELQVIVINDGSKDGTAAVVERACARYPWITFVDLKQNGGKARALNIGFKQVLHDIVITVDADSFLYKGALTSIVERYHSDPPNTRAVAGKILVRNSRFNWITRCQEWDYFHGIAAIKRVQSLFQGTLVAQGAFSLYDRDALTEVGGWPECVGEDIVLTWALLKAGYRIGHCEDACLFTNVPTSIRQLVKQRQRWARGMTEAFVKHPGILLQPRLSTFFIYWNLLFPWLDLAYTIGFMPGLVLALFGYFWIVGPMTLALIPAAFALSLLMFSIERRMFKKTGLVVRKNFQGFFIYVLLYSLILQPASVLGYLDELFKRPKAWGTK
ncbi:biofilm PGA synthesis N-glycosyltransferase PgaC [Variovorax sp. YR750]|uniref:glycosyltransferase n=1 Tax=Variovorax sp. YR750 TaxID=1884384 RepID=UPI0008AFEBB4|nr:glycosyltransferase [Variovorax sp. YR750]MDP9605106.1 biofilm PGA synthesis N-glycosyltransferase PgaC [Variovorax paradoxus]SEL86148.1 biofilm PGA synthesis N-glycosyltransferase PgaC [Variovorax sp. YR750]